MAWDDKYYKQAMSRIPAPYTAKNIVPRMEARMKASNQAVKMAETGLDEAKADVAVLQSNPIGRAQVKMKRWAQQNPAQAGRIIQAGQGIGRAVRGAAMGAAAGGVAKMARKVLPQTAKAFDTRLKDGAALKPNIRKILSGYYK